MISSAIESSSSTTVENDWTFMIWEIANPKFRRRIGAATKCHAGTNLV
jgi:hypothetical protein